MKRRLGVFLLSTLSLIVFSCAKKKEEKPIVEMPPPTEMPAPQVSTSPEMEKFYTDYMVEQARLSQEYAQKTSPTDRAEYEKKTQAIREKYRLDQHPDFREYYSQLSPEQQMQFMQKMGKAMAESGLKPLEK